MSFSLLDYVASQVGSSDLRWLLGMLTQPEEGKYFLEDLVTRLPLDLSNAVSLGWCYSSACRVVLLAASVAAKYRRLFTDSSNMV